jgi:hypothetical protein
MKIDPLATLIGQANVRKDLPDTRTSCAVVDVRGHFTLLTLARFDGILRASARGYV